MYGLYMEDSALYYSEKIVYFINYSLDIAYYPSTFNFKENHNGTL